MRRVVAVFVFLGLAYPAVAFVLQGIVGPGGAIAVGGITAATIVFLGVPAFALFLRMNWLRWWQFALGGGALGLCCAVPFAVGGGTLVAALAPAFLALGMLNGALFWVLALWRNADLSGRAAAMADSGRPPPPAGPVGTPRSSGSRAA
jgi:hypothetical protein